MIKRHFSSEELNKRLLKNQIEQERICAENAAELKKLLEKPPLGIMPRYIWDESRLIQLEEAIERRIGKVDNIPMEWIEERNELIERINKRS